MLRSLRHANFSYSSPALFATVSKMGVPPSCALHLPCSNRHVGRHPLGIWRPDSVEGAPLCQRQACWPDCNSHNKLASSLEPSVTQILLPRQKSFGDLVKISSPDFHSLMQAYTSFDKSFCSIYAYGRCTSDSRTTFLALTV